MRKSSKKFQKDIENNISIWYNLNIEKNITNEREKSNEKTKIKRNKRYYFNCISNNNYCIANPCRSKHR